MEVPTIYSEIIESAVKVEGRVFECVLKKRLTRVSTSDDSQDRVKKVCEFFDERYGKNRSITDIDWSPKVRQSPIPVRMFSVPPQYPELSVASYNKNPAALNEPAGIVAVWNLHMIERPEFVFHSQVLHVLCMMSLLLIDWSRMSSP